jgi:hypothetical protein
MRNHSQEAAAPIRDKLGLITEDELFALFEIETSTGRSRQSRGRLPPHYKVGKAKLYRLSEVQAWIRRQRVDRAL